MNAFLWVRKQLIFRTLRFFGVRRNGGFRSIVAA
jgi:hypothetical protein